jgi:DNA-binding SARP family transcriptional activator
MLSVTLLGGASFSVDGTLIKPDLGPAGRLLACYLFAFNRQVHRREKLADLFWSDVAPEKARSALNTAIWRIRKILELGGNGGAKRLITVGDDLILESSQTFEIDTNKLENASRRILSPTGGGKPTDKDIQEISVAVDGYRGPFLDGCDGDWVLQERERLHCLYVRSCFELMRIAVMESRYERALELGRRILAVDALRESVQRDLMLLLVLNGQRVEAIRAYKRLSDLLRSDLDIEPMPETKRLHSEIISGEIFNRLPQYTFTEFGIQKDRDSRD